MAKVRIVWEKDGLYNLRSAPGIVSNLDGRAEAVAAACGEGYEVGSQQGMKRPQGRWRTSVITATPASIMDNARNNTLIQNLGAAGG